MSKFVQVFDVINVIDFSLVLFSHVLINASDDIYVIHILKNCTATTIIYCCT